MSQCLRRPAYGIAFHQQQCCRRVRKNVGVDLAFQRRRAVHNCLKASGVAICKPGAYDGANATETFCVDIRLVFADPAALMLPTRHR